MGPWFLCCGNNILIRELQQKIEKVDLEAAVSIDHLGDLKKKGNTRVGRRGKHRVVKRFFFFKIRQHVGMTAGGDEEEGKKTQRACGREWSFPGVGRRVWGLEGGMTLESGMDNVSMVTGDKAEHTGTDTGRWVGGSMWVCFSGGLYFLRLMGKKVIREGKETKGIVSSWCGHW